MPELPSLRPPEGKDALIEKDMIKFNLLEDDKDLEMFWSSTSLL